jgi:diaminopimelate epimerase
MRVDFTKMHGAGNDFVVLDERSRPLSLDESQIRHIANRRLGVGCDQVVRLRPATARGADVLMLIHNPDGSMSSTCGNATRCVASLVAGSGDGAVIETLRGLLPSRVLADGAVAVDMGAPMLDARALGVADGIDTLHLPLDGDPAGCSMGNPHATFFLGDAEDVAVAVRGPAVERDPLFADGVNVGFASVVSGERIRLRVWERGAGLTLACGSGACAALVNASRRGLTGRCATVVLDGGSLVVEWREEDGHVLMTGPVAVSYRGTFEL